tara:strand:- start:568 stop:2283 length:1716 start_codon:yes stop_codon:yes gene_type:complete
MTYIPKSQIQQVVTVSDKELVYKSNNQPFSGQYMKTSNGQMFAGWNNLNIKDSEELTYSDNFIQGMKKAISGNSQKTLSFTVDAQEYGNQKRPIKSFLNNVNVIPVVKNRPLLTDYTRGWFVRYFIKRFNSFKYIEVSKTTYESLISKDGRYDHNLYEQGNIKWHIKGNNVYRLNSLEIKKQSVRFPNLINLFPILNEFHAPSTKVEENLHTPGGELFYGNGVQYIGYYHIHPTQGPMVGATHGDSPHHKLYYQNQLPSIGDSSYEDFLQNFNKVTCYKCFKYEGVGSMKGTMFSEIISLQRSRLFGCPKNSYTTYEAAAAACFPEVQNPGGEGNVLDVEEIGINNPGGEGGVCGTTSGYGGTDIGGGFVNIGGGWYWDGNQWVRVTGGGGSGGGGGGGGRGGMPAWTCFTPNTLITMADGTEKEISSIKIGEKVKSEKGESTVLEIKIHEGDHEVYSINGSKPFVTEEHPFKTIDGWKAINPFTTLDKHQIQSTVLDLHDVMIRIDGNSLVKSIEVGKIKYKKVYNLSLDNEHVFYANGYLVHNEKTAGRDNLELPSEGGQGMQDGWGWV